MTKAQDAMFEEADKVFPDKAVEVEKDIIPDGVDIEDVKRQDAENALTEERKNTMLTVSPQAEYTIIMSTDGKHSVVGKSLKGDNLKAVYQKVDEIYSYMLEKKGSKQHQNVEAYKGIKTGARAYPANIKAEKVYVEGRVCKDCQGRLVVGVGKVKSKCENNRWDFTTKKNIGTCEFIEWNVPATP